MQARTEKREQPAVLKITKLKTCCRFLKFWTPDKTSHTAEGVQIPPTSPAQQQMNVAEKLHASQKFVKSTSSKAQRAWV